MTWEVAAKSSMIATLFFGVIALRFAIDYCFIRRQRRGKRWKR